jgi:outer membrane protein assembly factor BamB
MRPQSTRSSSVAVPHPHAHAHTLALLLVPLLAPLLGACDAAPTEGRRDTGELDIEWQIQALTFVAPVVADSLVIARLADGRLAAFRRLNGSVAWQGGGVEVNFTSPLRLSGDAVIVAHQTLSAIDARNGQLLWERADPGSPAGVHEPAVLDGRVFAAESDAATALDAMTGDVDWRVEMPGMVIYPPQAAHGVVVFHTRVFEAEGRFSGGEIVVLEAGSGQERWRYKIHRDASNAPVIAGVAILDDRVVASTLNGGMVALALADGAELWELAEPALAENGFVLPPTPFAGSVVFLRTDGALEARGPADGAIAWTVALPSLQAFNSAPVRCGDRLCHGSGALSVVDAAGGVLWTSDDFSNLTFTSAPASDADGVVYVGAAVSASDNRLMAIRPAVPVGASLRR